MRQITALGTAGRVVAVRKNGTTSRKFERRRDTLSLKPR